MRSDINKRSEKVKIQDVKYREMPDIVVKVVCRYRAELFFKISRKTKLTKLFNAWTDRMERNGGKKGDGKGDMPLNGSAKTDAASTFSASSSTTGSSMQFVFTHNGRTVDSEQTPEEAGMEDGDEILAVELMDLTEGVAEEWVGFVRSCAVTFLNFVKEEVLEPPKQKLKKYWNDDPQEYACVHFGRKVI